MIDIQKEVKQAYDFSTVQLDKIVVNNKEYPVTNVQFYDDVYEEGNIFGTAIAKCLEFEIENIIDLEGQEFEYLTGIVIEGITEWISLGKFITQSVEPNDTTNINKVVAMDYMLKSNIPYTTELPYQNGTVTILQVAQEACMKSGFILATLEFANNDFIVDSNQFAEGSLIRQVFQAIAQISGTVAKIKTDNKLYFINPNEVTTVSKKFTLNNYQEAEIKRNTQPINSVSLAMQDIEGENISLKDDESIAKYGENALVINNNPFAYTQAKREQLITALFNAVKGFDYKAYTFKCQGLPYLETMDKIQFLDKAGNTYDSHIFRFNYKSPKGLESTIEAPSIIKASVEYANLPSAMEISKRTEYMVDKQNQKITQLAQQSEEYEEKLTEVIQTVDCIEQNVGDIIDYKRETQGYTEIHLVDSGEQNILKLEINGNKTYETNLYPRPNLYPRANLHSNQKGG